MRALFRQYLDLLEKAQGESVELEEVPAELRALALRAWPSIDEMLRAERKLLAREQAVLKQITRAKVSGGRGPIVAF